MKQPQKIKMIYGYGKQIDCLKEIAYLLELFGKDIKIYSVNFWDVWKENQIYAIRYISNPDN